MNTIAYGKGICYSGYRDGQSPVHRTYPSYDEVLEDLRILDNDYDYIRMYDGSPHAETALRAIRDNDLNLKVMLGIDLLGEISNPNCSWGGDYTDEEIARNIRYNESQLRQVIALANKYPDQVLAVSAGNEAVPEWNENLVSPGRVLYFVEELKRHTDTIVTYCDNNFYWLDTLDHVAQAVDVISIHIYPVWLGADIEEGLTRSIREYNEIVKRHPDKQVIITEIGWPTRSNGGPIPVEHANEVNQLFYTKEMERWADRHGVVCFFFEAFDEPWKGSEDPNEPEKHWGFYNVHRQPKRVKQS